jgi:hypothetical protein
MIVVNSLWIGDKLTTLEHLSMLSHIRQGHEYHLWVYDNVEVPKGVFVEDAEKVLPASEIFCYSGPLATGGGSVSAFSNVFRYKLLSEQDGWWCDTDVVCLKPFNFKSYAYATEQLSCGTIVPTTCVFSVPREVARFCYRTANNKDRTKVQWGEIGPALFGISVSSHGNFAQQPSVFCPIGWWEHHRFFEQTELPNECYGVHLWNEMWRRKEINKDGSFARNCLYEQLKRLFMPQFKMI